MELSSLNVGWKWVFIQGKCEPVVAVGNYQWYQDIILSRVLVLEKKMDDVIHTPVL